MNDSFWHKLFSFRLVSLCGIIIALYVFSLTSETKSLSSFLFSAPLYIVSSLVAIAIQTISWIVIDKGTFYEFSHILGQTLQDCVIINLIVVCTLSFLFLVTSFI